VAEEQSHILVDKVRRGELDVGILALPYPCDGLLSLKFWDEDFYWVSHTDLVPNKKSANISPRTLQHQNLMLLSEGHCLKDHALAACHLTSSAAHSLSATSLTTLIQLVRSKMGSTLVPETALDQLVDIYPELSKLPLDEPGPHRQLAFIFRPNYPNFGNIEALRKLASNILKTQLGKK
jgi:LysR family hydrogen peroxide-inducible transcriptional activator